MFDLNKLGDMSKIASQAKRMQQSTEDFQKQELELLSKISKQLEQVLTVLRDNN